MADTVLEGRLTGLILVVAEVVDQAGVVFNVVVGMLVVLVVSTLVLEGVVVIATEVVVESSEVVLNIAIISKACVHKENILLTLLDSQENLSSLSYQCRWKCRW